MNEEKNDAVLAGICSIILFLTGEGGAYTLLGIFGIFFTLYLWSL